MSKVAPPLARFAAVLLLPAIVSAARAQGPAAPRDMPLSRLEGGALAGQAQTPPPASPERQLPPLPLTRLDDRPRAELDGPRTLTLTFSQPLPLRDVLLLLARDTPFSIVPDSTVGGSFAGELKDLTLRQALEAVLFPQGLDYDVHGSVIRVFQRKPATRLYEIDHLNLQRAWQRRVRGTADVSAQPLFAELTTSSHSDLFSDIEAGVTALLSSSGRAHVDRQAGLVQVTDFADRLDQIGVYLDAIRLRSTRQVRIDARVFEVTLSPPATALDWQAIAARAGSAIDMGPRSPAAGMRVNDIGGVLKAIAEQGTVRTIATPHVLAMNNEPAVMRVGTGEVFFGAQGGGPSVVTEGLTLVVVPQIAADGIVQLSVSPTYAQKTGQTKGSKGASAPILHIRETDSLLRVQEGETVVVSGLLQERLQTKTAGGFTGMFGAQEHRTVVTELVVMLTPAVVTPAAAMPEEAR